MNNTVITNVLFDNNVEINHNNIIQLSSHHTHAFFQGVLCRQFKRIFTKNIVFYKVKCT